MSLNVITYTDNSHESKTFICVCVSVVPHNRTKTAETIMPQG